MNPDAWRCVMNGGGMQLARVERQIDSVPAMAQVLVWWRAVGGHGYEYRHVSRQAREKWLVGGRLSLSCTVCKDCPVACASRGAHAFRLPFAPIALSGFSPGCPRLAVSLAACVLRPTGPCRDADNRLRDLTRPRDTPRTKTVPLGPAPNERQRGSSYTLREFYV